MIIVFLYRVLGIEFFCKSCIYDVYDSCNVVDCFVVYECIIYENKLEVDFFFLYWNSFKGIVMII